MKREFVLALGLCATILGGCGSSGGAVITSPSGVGGTGLSAAEFLNLPTTEAAVALRGQSVGQNRYLVYTAADDLLPGDDNGHSDIYLVDLRTRSTTLLTRALDGSASNGDSGEARISHDGRFVSFRSSATNLVAGDGNGVDDVFVKDLHLDKTEIVSLSSDGNQGNAGSYSPSVSDGGRFVVFASEADNLSPGDGNAMSDVFLRDTESGTTVRLTEGAEGPSGHPRISADGSMVCFETEANQLAGLSLPGSRQIVSMPIANPQLAVLESEGSNGPADSDCFYPEISGDGKVVAFFTQASNLSDDTNQLFDIYIKNRDAVPTRLSSPGVEPNGHTGFPTLSYDGSSVAFVSNATNLVGGGTNGLLHTFASSNNAIQLVSQSSEGETGDDNSDLGVISGDGEFVVFRTQANNLGSADLKTEHNVFARHLSEASTSPYPTACKSTAEWKGLAAPVVSPAFDDPNAIALGDLEGLGQLDVATVHPAENMISLLLRGFNETLLKAVEFTTQPDPIEAAFVDVTGNGKLEFATANSGSNSVSIFIDETISKNGRRLDLSSGGINVQGFVFSDVDCDGNQDLIVANKASQTVSVAFNSGNAEFGQPALLATNGEPVSVDAGDLNGDGLPEVVATLGDKNSIVVFINNGSGQFPNSTTLPTGKSPKKVRVYDVDNDGKKDLVVSNIDESFTTFYYNDGSGNFGNPARVSSFTGIRDFGIGDLNGDGVADLAAVFTAADKVTLVLSTGPRRYGQLQSFDTQTGPQFLALGDMNNDGNLDVVVSSPTDNSVSILLNRGCGN